VNLTQTPNMETAMILVLFRSRFTDQVDEEYDITEDRLAKKVRDMAGPDLVQVKNYVAEDGERLALVWWRNAEMLEKWRNDPEHQEAQQLGREQWYSFYELSVAEVVRTSSSEEDTAYPSP
jgi:heme-degrading monooxygenase HmoA